MDHLISAKISTSTNTLSYQYLMQDTEDEVAASRVSRNVGYCGSENSFMNALSIFNESCFSSDLRIMFVFVLSMDARFVRASGVF